MKLDVSKVIEGMNSVQAQAETETEPNGERLWQSIKKSIESGQYDGQYDTVDPALYAGILNTSGPITYTHGSSLGAIGNVGHPGNSGKPGVDYVIDYRKAQQDAIDIKWRAMIDSIDKP